MGSIQIDSIKKSFDEKEILKGITLNIPESSFSILLGPSGCGKSTLLRIIAGLESEDSGDILMDGESISELEPKDRKVAMVFQNYALYPHMTVFKNIEYGLKIQKIEKENRRQMVDDVLKLVELEDQEKKMPYQMSGGQRQRVALARAIVKKPEVFLMDEPLSNLDAKLRNQMRFELIKMHKKINSTFLYVTHDQVEAMSMGTNIIIMNGGEIMQVGSPKEIYNNPSNLFVAQFIGSPPTNIISVEREYIGIRPEKIKIINYKEIGLFDSSFIVECKVQSIEQLGGESIYHVESEIGSLNVRSTACWDYQEECKIGFNIEDLMYFGEDGLRLNNPSENIEEYINKTYKHNYI